MPKDKDVDFIINQESEASDIQELTETPEKEKCKEKEGKKKRSGVRKFFLIFAALLILFLVVSGVWLGSFWSRIYEVVAPGMDILFPGQDASAADTAVVPDIMNILLLGLDSRDESIRTDTIMVMTLNSINGEISLFSLPRDMMVPIPGHGKDKVNHAYAYGGVALSRETVEDFLDIKFDYYLSTDFDGFENIIKILGGIDLDVEKRMYYNGIDIKIDLQPGPQHLDGDKALQYVRWRSDSEADLGRVRRQQEFMKALLQELIAFKNILKIPKLLPEIAEYIRTDLELNQALSLANKLKNMDFEQINTFTFPGRPGMQNGVSYLFPQEEEIKALVDEYMK